MQADEAALGILTAAYQGREWSESSIQLYGDAIRKYPPEVAMRAVEKLVGRDSPFPPSFGELLHAMREELAGLPSGVEAWSMVQTREGRLRAPTPVMDAVKVLHPHVYEDIANTPRPDLTMRNFLEVYAEIREKAVTKHAEDHEAGRLLRPVPEIES